MTEATIVNGGKLKEAGTANWWEPNDAHNETGFTALPGSLRYSGGGWGYPYLPGGGTLGSAACFWSTEEENIDKASLMILIYSGPDISIGSIEKKCGLSVRCIKNED